MKLRGATTLTPAMPSGKVSRSSQKSFLANFLHANQSFIYEIDDFNRGDRKVFAFDRKIVLAYLSIGR